MAQRLTAYVASRRLRTRLNELGVGARGSGVVFVARRTAGGPVLTMAELAARELIRPRVIDDRLVTPGRVNREGNLSDPEGVALSRVEGEWSEDQALAAVRAGAHVAYEDCGCGGGAGCQPDWFTGEELNLLRQPPQPTRGSAPSWIEIWQAPQRRVVFVHGDYRWHGLF